MLKRFAIRYNNELPLAFLSAMKMYDLINLVKAKSKPASGDRYSNLRPASLNVQSEMSDTVAIVAMLTTGFLATTALKVVGYWPAKWVTRNPP